MTIQREEIVRKEQLLEKQKLEFKKQQKYPTLFLLFMLLVVGGLFAFTVWWSKTRGL